MPGRRKLRHEREDAEREASRSDVESYNLAQVEKWKQSCRQIDEHNAKLEVDYEVELTAWRERKAAHELLQSQTNSAVHLFKNRYLARDPGAIEEYFDLVLTHSEYPPSFQNSFQVQYVLESRELVVDFELPSPEALPKAKGYRYVAKDDEIVETELAESAQRKLFDSVVYQVTLRTLHEVFEADTVEALDSATFIGHVESLDRATGTPRRTPILALTVSKVDFMKLNLEAVAPRDCVRKLGAAMGGEPHALADVPSSRSLRAGK